jgi:hypothetical protein
MSFSKVLLPAVIALVLAPAICSGATTGTIRGRVVTSDGDPVEDALVVIEETRGKTTTTDTGFFVFVGVSPGVYTLTVTLGEEVRHVVSEVVVHADLSSRVSVRLDGDVRASTYFQILAHEPGTAFILAGRRVLSLPLKFPAQCIRTVPSRVEIDEFF